MLKGHRRTVQAPKFYKPFVYYNILRYSASKRGVKELLCPILKVVFSGGRKRVSHSAIGNPGKYLRVRCKLSQNRENFS